MLNFEHQLRSHLSCMFIWRDVRLFPTGACSWLMGWIAGAAHGKSGGWHICTGPLGAFSLYFCIKYVTLAYRKVKIYAESKEKKYICILKKNNHLYQCRTKILARSPSAVEQTLWLLYHIDLEGTSNLSPGIQIVLVKNQIILSSHCKFLERLKDKQEGNSLSSAPFFSPTGTCISWSFTRSLSSSEGQVRKLNWLPPPCQARS